jgi:uncharacterized lipoprotein YehR (DUF1307 family)
MKQRVIYAIFALMLIGISLSGCRSKELCPAYTDNISTTEEVTEGTI